MSTPDQPANQRPSAADPPPASATTDPATPDPASTDAAAPEAASRQTAADDPWQDAQLPWEGKPRRVDLICLSLISLSGIYYMLLTPAIPALLGTNPVLLALLAGSTPATVTAGAFAAVGRASLPLAVAAGVIGLMKFDVLFWWAGRLWGRRAAELIAGRGPRANRVIGRLEWLLSRFGWLAVVVIYFLPLVPKGVVFAAASWTGMRLVTFLALSFTGALLRIGLNVWLGYTIGEPAVEVAETISDYALWLTIALVVVIFGYQFWRARRDQQEAAAARRQQQQPEPRR